MCNNNKPKKIELQVSIDIKQTVYWECPICNKYNEASNSGYARTESLNITDGSLTMENAKCGRCNYTFTTSKAIDAYTDTTEDVAIESDNYDEIMEEQ